MKEDYEAISESGESKIIKNHHSLQSDVSDQSDEDCDSVVENMSDDCDEITWQRDDLNAENGRESPAVSMNDLEYSGSECEEMSIKDGDSTTHQTDDEIVDDGSTVKSADVYFYSANTKFEPASPGSDDSNSDSQQLKDKPDLRAILNSSPSRLEVDDETFVRFCQRHIVTKLIKKGRRSFLDRVPPKNVQNEDDGLQVVHNVVGRHLKADLLISRMASLSYPSENWFHTVKDGAPTFFCWSDGFRIDKTVILSSRSLEPTVSWYLLRL